MLMLTDMVMIPFLGVVRIRAIIGQQKLKHVGIFTAGFLLHMTF
jgi:hypothetical protein